MLVMMSSNFSFETWLKDAALSLFMDTHDCSPSMVSRGRDLVGQLRKFWASFRRDLKYTNGVGSLQNTWPTVDLSRFSAVAAEQSCHPFVDFIHSSARLTSPLRSTVNELFIIDRLSASAASEVTALTPKPEDHPMEGRARVVEGLAEAPHPLLACAEGPEVLCGLRRHVCVQLHHDLPH
ncbi:hypothetical protein BHM03_00005519 [Ensete ventricosum]|nr:hypothetical protein BHM03_00005519 [Ensete ventricosum]